MYSEKWVVRIWKCLFNSSLETSTQSGQFNSFPVILIISIASNFLRVSPKYFLRGFNLHLSHWRYLPQTFPKTPFAHQSNFLHCSKEIPTPLSPHNPLSNCTNGSPWAEQSFCIPSMFNHLLPESLVFREYVKRACVWIDTNHFVGLHVIILCVCQ